MDPKTIIIISDASIKNNVATSILYICSSRNILAKTIYYAVNITSTKAELFTIRYKINQAIHVSIYILATMVYYHILCNKLLT